MHYLCVYVILMKSHDLEPLRGTSCERAQIMCVWLDYWLPGANVEPQQKDYPLILSHTHMHSIPLDV